MAEFQVSDLIYNLFVDFNGKESLEQRVQDILSEEELIRFEKLDLNEFDLDIKIRDIDYCKGIIENEAYWSCLQCHNINPKVENNIAVIYCKSCN